MSLIFVDCEATGPCPGIGFMTEFGAVESKTEKTFHGVMWVPAPNQVEPEAMGRHGPILQKFEVQRTAIMFDFETWLKQFGSNRLIFVSDNPAYDFQWINYEFCHLLGHNPFGHSARRISDFYAGLVGNFYTPQKWKDLRVTPHDHNPVNDAVGNLEAFNRLLAGER